MSTALLRAAQPVSLSDQATAIGATALEHALLLVLAVGLSLEHRVRLFFPSQTRSLPLDSTTHFLSPSMIFPEPNHIAAPLMPSHRQALHLATSSHVHAQAELALVLLPPSLKSMMVGSGDASLNLDLTTPPLRCTIAVRLALASLASIAIPIADSALALVRTIKPARAAPTLRAPALSSSPQTPLDFTTLRMLARPSHLP